MFDSLRAAIDAHALGAWPEASCGAIFRAGDAVVYHPVEDAADDSRMYFRLESETLARLEAKVGRLAALVHSHTCDSEGESDPLQHTPSAAEMGAQLGHGVPFGVVVCTRERVVDRFWFGDQCPPWPLLGRPFRHGVWDCYSAVRDWYRLEQGLVLPEFPRDWDWWAQGLDMYEESFGKAGFRIIDREEVGPGDAALFRIRAKVPNHAAVMTDAEWMFHHPAVLSPFDVTRVSQIDRIERWARFVTHWLRPPSG